MNPFQGLKGFLRQLDNKTQFGQMPSYVLPWNQEVFMGRDPTCQIALSSTVYAVVSRRHVAIRPLAPHSATAPAWEICDLDSANGTYVNGRRLQGCQPLRAGDRILLGQDGAEFIFEYQQISDNTQVAPIRANLIQSDSVSFTQLFPIFSTGRDLARKAYLIPGVITVAFVVLMFASVGEPVVFNLVLAAYLAGAAYYFVYQLCGKHKPWWVLLASALTTVLILVSPLLMAFTVFFRAILPGKLPTEGSLVSFPDLLVRMFFGAGLMEELLKALPVLLAYLVGRFLLRSPWRERVGVWEPLDGILLGAASAVGFTLLETLGQYVPEIVNNVNLQASKEAGQLMGLQLLIPRVLGSVAGHMAYSGYFGYFIGLSVLRPRNSGQTLLIGCLSSAGLHALWNASGFFSALILAVVGVLSYAFLTSAILKARALSPTRSQNFATHFFHRP